MAWRHYLEAFIPLGGGLSLLWLVWRSVRTGMLFGNPAVNPRRHERRRQFWSIVSLYAALAAWLIAEGVRRLVAAS